MTRDQHNSPDAALSQIRRLDELCDDYEQALRQGRALSIDEYIADCSYSDSEELRNELEVIVSQFGAGSAGGQSDSPFLSIFGQVESLCFKFHAELAAGKQPRIEAYLNETPSGSREMLLRNLLLCEYRYSQQNGESLDVEQYVDRFPEFASSARCMLAETITRDVDPDTGVTKATAPFPVAGRLGEYELVREIGRGGMGAVYEAIHVNDGQRVALKTLPRVDGPRLHLFKREFRAMAEVNHLNLVSMYTLECDGSQWFFTMELLEGTDFLQYVRPHDQLHEGRLRTTLSQLVTGISALHASHFIHRDLKPSNVMVTSEGRVKLLDFGLIFEQDRTSLTDDRMMGTPRYMAPEQAASEKVTTACDWYAAGVMLYEALEGNPPFSGSWVNVLQDKQSIDPPPINRDGVPRDLAELAAKLLSRDSAARPTENEILALVSEVTSDSAPPATTGCQLVGRESHLGVLSVAFDDFQRQSEATTVFVSGLSGEGKSALVEHFLEPLRHDPNLAVLSGRCYDRESVPFKAIDSLIDALGSYLRGLPSDKAASLMPRDVAMLAKVFPVLQRVPSIAEAPTARLKNLDEQQVRTRAFAALRELLLRLGDRTPVVMFIDDLQWGDADSAQAMFEVLRPPEPPVILFLGSYRRDEAEDSAFLREWNQLPVRHEVTMPSREVSVGPLSDEQCAELVAATLGIDLEAAREKARQLAEQTAGNAFLLTELAAAIDTTSKASSIGSLDEIIARRLERLPPAATGLLEVIAVSGQALAVDEARQVFGHDEAIAATLSLMRTERLVKQIGSDDEPFVDTYHDRIRETVLGQMSADRRREVHESIARTIARTEQLPAKWLEQLDADNVDEVEEELPVISRIYDLAYHYDAAGIPEQAWQHALYAAEQAKRQSALEVAVEQYEIVDRNLRKPNNFLSYRIASEWGHALMLIGRYDAAAIQFQRAGELLADPLNQALIELRKGQLAFKQGKPESSVEHFERGLRRIGMWVPRSRTGLATAIVIETIVQTMHRLWPSRLHRQPDNRSVEIATLLCSELGNTTAFTNSGKMIWAGLTGMNRGERVSHSSSLVYSYAVANVILQSLGLHRLAKVYIDLGINSAIYTNDLWAERVADLFRSMAFYSSGQYGDGLQSYANAIKAITETGDLWELNVHQFHVGCCHWGLGNIIEAAHEACQSFERSVRIGDIRTHCNLYLLTAACDGDLPVASIRETLRETPDDILSTCNLDKAEGIWHLSNRRYEESTAAFERALDIPRRNLVANFHVFAGLPWLIQARRQFANSVESSNPKLSQDLRRRAFRLASRGRWICRFFPTSYPHALREWAHALAHKGKTKRAWKVAVKSCEVAEKQNAKYEYAQSLALRGQLAEQLGLPEAEQQIEEAEQELARFKELMQQTAKETRAALKV